VMMEPCSKGVLLRRMRGGIKRVRTKEYFGFLEADVTGCACEAGLKVR
jgi:hypothetical protein